ncbi:MAG: NUDIX domain-containing protein [Chloroflexi bacterium]|nr:NUDIX domain-containing protein [Chloroflexota bacterium]
MYVWRLAGKIFNSIPVRWQRRILDRAHPRFLVGVNGVGVTGDGNVVLARHRFGSPQWRLLGGFIGREESFQDALRREIREETGLDVEVGPILEANTGHRWARVEIVYAYRVIGGSFAPTNEVSEVGSFPPSRLPPVRADQRGYVERHTAGTVAWARERSGPATIDV